MRLPFELVPNGSATKVAGETRNVSSSGVLFTASKDLEVGDTIEYLITFPKAPRTRASVRLHCMGKVLRQDSEKLAFAATLERYEFERERA